MNNRQRSRRGTAQQVGRTSKVHPTCRSWLILFVGVLVCVALNPVALDSPAAANALPAHPQAAQDTGSLEYLGQIGGENTSVAIQGNYAYVSHGTSLVVLDITDPAMPVKMGRTPSLRGLAGQATLAGDYAYLILRPVWPDTIYRISVLNIADRANPVEVGSYETAMPLYYLSVASGYVFASARAGGLGVIDVSNPASPVEVGFFTTFGSADLLIISGNHAYLSDSGVGLRVIDISAPASPVEVGFLAGVIECMQIVGNYAYLQGGYTGLRMVDISDPTNPVFVGTSALGYDRKLVAATGETLIFFYWYYSEFEFINQIHLVDISEPTAPVVVSAYYLPFQPLVIVAAGELVFTASVPTGSLYWTDISDPSAPVEGGEYHPVGSGPMAIAGETAYILDYYGLRVVDISNPAHADDISAFHTSDNEVNYRAGFAISPGYAYITYVNTDFRVVDISDPAHPVETGHFDPPWESFDLVVSGDTVYAAARTAGLRVVDVSDPAHPREVNYAVTPYNAVSVTVAGGYVYLAAGEAGMRIFDLADPENPVEVGAYDTPGNVIEVAVAGEYAYVLDDSTSGMYILEISEPELPVEVSFYDALELAGYSEVAVCGAYAYVTDVDNGLRVINITSPAAPVEAAFYKTAGYAWQVSVSGSNIYLFDRDYGLYMLRSSLQPSLPHVFLPILTK